MADFSWVSFMADFRKALLDFTNQREALYDIMRRTEIRLRNQYPNDKFKDFTSSGAFAGLTEADRPKADVDPFSVLRFITKFYPKRQTVMQYFLEEAGIPLTCPESLNATQDMENGIIEETSFTTMLAQGRYRSEDVDHLWTLLRDMHQNQINESIFDQVLKIHGVGIRTLSRELYYFMPETFFPFVEHTTGWIKALGLSEPQESWQSYHAFLKALEDKTNGRPLYECVREALLQYKSNKESTTTMSSIQQAAIQPPKMPLN